MLIIFARLVQLVDGKQTSNVYSGRVEVLNGHGWSTVCDNGWDLNGGNVTCRQLGYDVLSTERGSVYGEGRGNISVTNVSCQGNEGALQSCSHYGLEQYNCSHREGAGVTCYKGMYITIGK